MSRTRFPPKLISVLIPVPEASPDLEEIHRQASVQLRSLDTDYEMLYLVSTDAASTLRSLRTIHEQNPDRVRVIQFAKTVDEAAMLGAGFEQRRGDLLFTIPRRFETDFACIPLLYEAIRDGADVAVACRSRSERSARIQSRLFNRLISWAAGTRLHDVASGMRAIRPEVLGEIRLYGDFHRYLPLLALRSGFQVREVPFALHSREGTRPIQRPHVYVWRALDIASVLLVSHFSRKPLRLFGGVGFCFAAVGFLMLLVIGIERILGTPLANRPALLLATLLIGLGVQAVAIGLLGELMLFFKAGSERDYGIATHREVEPSALPRSDRAGTEEPREPARGYPHGRESDAGPGS